MKVLAVALHAGIWVHSFPEDLILRSLAGVGVEVQVLRCKGSLDTACVTLDGLGVRHDAPERERTAACNKCRQRRTLLEIGSSLETIFIDDLVDRSAESEISEYVNSLTKETWHEVHFRALPVARLTAYELFLGLKLNSLSIPEEAWEQFKRNVVSSCRVLVAASRVMDASLPDAVIVYNGLYSVNNVVCREASRRGTRTWAMHAGTNLRHRFERMFVYSADTIPTFSYESEAWQRVQREPLTKQKVDLAVDHYLEVLKAVNRFAYSSPIGGHGPDAVRNALGIEASRKVLVATLSSQDEMLAASIAGLKPPKGLPTIFPSIFEWVDWLISFVSGRSDLHLVIRVHPREFPNKREAVVSQNASRLKEKLNSLPQNVTVNWPDDGISLYDLAQIMNVCANFTSSAGIEMMMLGIPAVLPSNEFMAAYDPRISYLGLTEDDFEAKLNRAVSDGWSVENIRSAMRWWGFLFGNVGIDISDGFTYPSAGYSVAASHGKRSLKSELLNLAARHAPPVLEVKHALRRRQLASTGLLVDALERGDRYVVSYPATDSEQSEDEAVAHGIARVVASLREKWDPDVRLLEWLTERIQDR